jgi:hypothetical protein
MTEFGQAAFKSAEKSMWADLSIEGICEWRHQASPVNTHFLITFISFAQASQYR